MELWDPALPLKLWGGVEGLGLGLECMELGWMPLVPYFQYLGIHCRGKLELELGWLSWGGVGWSWSWGGPGLARSMGPGKSELLKAFCQGR